MDRWISTLRSLGPYEEGRGSYVASYSASQSRLGCIRLFQFQRPAAGPLSRVRCQANPEVAVSRATLQAVPSVHYRPPAAAAGT